MAIPTHITEKVDDVLHIYEKLDGEIEEFRAASLLRCAKGCGRCCDNPNVFATVLEVLPLAYALWQEDEAKNALLKISRCAVSKTCVFYQPDPLRAGHGRCSVYRWRPLICRLFGYSTKRNKNGQSQIVTCPTMKKVCATEIDQTSQRLRDGSLPAPAMQDYALRVFSLDPYLGKEQLPINEAVKIALEKVGWYIQNEKVG